MVGEHGKPILRKEILNSLLYTDDLRMLKLPENPSSSFEFLAVKKNLFYLQTGAIP